MNATEIQVNDLREILTDDEILNVLILFQSRKIDACRALSYAVFPKWNITVLEAMSILQKLNND